MLRLKVDNSLKGVPQSGIVDPSDMLFENSRAPRIIERGDHLADFAARPAKKLGADGCHCSPSASISSAMANTAASCLGSQVMAKRRSSNSHSRIRPARASREPNCRI
jgi:hypothetical protein